MCSVCNIYKLVWLKGVSSAISFRVKCPLIVSFLNTPLRAVLLRSTVTKSRPEPGGLILPHSPAFVENGTISATLLVCVYVHAGKDTDQADTCCDCSACHPKRNNREVNEMR